MRHLICVSLLVSMSSAAQEPSPDADAGVAPAPFEAAVSPTARLDQLFDTRGPAAVDQEHDQRVAQLYQAHPDDFEIAWRMARWKVWKADTAPNDKAKQAFAKEGWAAGDVARKLRPNDVRGHYYAGAAVGLYAQGLGILNALAEGVEGKFNERIDAAVKLDPFLDRGGPLVSKGRYWFELPWPLRNLDKSKECLNKVIARHPENLRAHMYLAETLLKDGKAKDAKAAIDRALTGDAAYDPAEVGRVRLESKRIAAEIAKAL